MTAPKAGGSHPRPGRPHVDVFGQLPRRSVLALTWAVVALGSIGTLGALMAPVVNPAVAQAASVSTLKAQAQVIGDEIANDNAHLDTLGTTYVNEQGAYIAAGIRETLTRHLIQRDQHFIALDRLRVQTAVISAYVTGNVTSSPIVNWSSNPNTEISTTTYLGVATDQLTSVISQYNSDQRSLDASLVTEQRTMAAAASAYSATNAARASVLATVNSEQQLYNSTDAQLNALVAAAAARAAAAQARAQAAAAAAVAATAAAGPPAPTAIATVSTTSPPPTTLSAAFAAIRNCESSDDYSLNTGNGYYGAYQFALSTWQNLGQSGLPSSAAPTTQDAAAFLLYQRAGDTFASWPTCAAIAGLG